MPITATVKKVTYEGTKTKHAEQVMFDSGKYESGNFTVELTGWPCMERAIGGFHCHNLFIRKSTGRVITVNITADTGGYALSHGKTLGATGTITYNNGLATYS